MNELLQIEVPFSPPAPNMLRHDKLLSKARYIANHLVRDTGFGRHANEVEESGAFKGIVAGMFLAADSNGGDGMGEGIS